MLSDRHGGDMVDAMLAEAQDGAPRPLSEPGTGWPMYVHLTCLAVASWDEEQVRGIEEPFCGHCKRRGPWRRAFVGGPVRFA